MLTLSGFERRLVFRCPAAKRCRQRRTQFSELVVLAPGKHPEADDRQRPRPPQPEPCDQRRDKSQDQHAGGAQTVLRRQPRDHRVGHGLRHGDRRDRQTAEQVGAQVEEERDLAGEQVGRDLDDGRAGHHFLGRRQHIVAVLLFAAAKDAKPWRIFCSFLLLARS
mgnify:CR=1 FL=1